MYHPETENFIQDASARSFRRALNIFFLLLGGALLGAGLGWLVIRLFSPLSDSVLTLLYVASLAAFIVIPRLSLRGTFSKFGAEIPIIFMIGLFTNFVIAIPILALMLVPHFGRHTTGEFLYKNDDPDTRVIGFKYNVPGRSQFYRSESTVSSGGFQSLKRGDPIDVFYLHIFPDVAVVSGAIQKARNLEGMFALNLGLLACLWLAGRFYQKWPALQQKIEDPIQPAQPGTTSTYKLRLPNRTIWMSFLIFAGIGYAWLAIDQKNYFFFLFSGFWIYWGLMYILYTPSYWMLDDQRIVYHSFAGSETRLNWEEVTQLKYTFLRGTQIYGAGPKQSIRLNEDVPQLLELVRQRRPDLWMPSGRQTFQAQWNLLSGFFLACAFLLWMLDGNLLGISFGIFIGGLVVISHLSSPYGLTLEGDQLRLDYFPRRKKTLRAGVIREILLRKINGSLTITLNLHMGDPLDLNLVTVNSRYLYNVLLTWWKNQRNPND